MKALWRRPEALLGLVLVLSAVLTALLAPWIAPYDPLAVDLARKLMPPSAEHWMGTDQTGRDIFSRIIWGARPSLTVGILAVTIGALGGIAIGLTAGYARERLRASIATGLAAGAWGLLLFVTPTIPATVPTLAGLVVGRL